MPFKFERLEVWRQALDYLDLVYNVANQLPKSEEYNLKSQIVRTATSVALNIAEGSTGLTNPEQARFLSIAIRSLIETVACQHVIRRRGLATDSSLLAEAYTQAEVLVARLHSMRRALEAESHQVRETNPGYLTEAAELLTGEQLDDV